MSITAGTIREKILGALVGAEVTVADTTGGGDHYAARVVHAGFEGRSLIDRHRLVYAALGEAMKADIHALALETLTPAEAASRKPGARTVTKEMIMALSPELTERIEKTISGNRIMLFMKGSPSMPQCGFSATVVQLLKEAGATFGSFNILADNDLREGLKQYSSWPTFPQLYVDGKLVGGCDIVRELHARGELASTLGVAS